jgi:hypothetical protein
MIPPPNTTTVDARPGQAHLASQRRQGVVDEPPHESRRRRRMPSTIASMDTAWRSTGNDRVTHSQVV